MNVFESAQERIAYCFREFDYVYVSFSGGKDSGVLLELTAMEAAKAIADEMDSNDATIRYHLKKEGLIK